MSFTLPEIVDSAIEAEMHTAQTGIVNSTARYIRSEICIKKICANIWVQMLVPLVLIVLAVMIIKPAWSVRADADGRVSYKYRRIAAMSAIMYVISMLALFAVKVYAVRDGGNTINSVQNKSCSK